MQSKTASESELNLTEAVLIWFIFVDLVSSNVPYLL